MRRIFFLATVLFVSWLVGYMLEVGNNDQVISFTAADFQLDNSEHPPDTVESNWQKVKLPDLWDYQRPDASGAGWYRFKIKLHLAPKHLWGIYLPRINQHATVFLNNVILGSGASVEQKQTTSWNHPLYFTIPKGLLTSGGNNLYIRLQSAANSRGRLLPFYMGPDEFLRPVFDKNFFFRVTLSQLIGVFALTMGVCIGLVWIVRREPVYGWFALGSFFWAFYTSWFFVQRVPFELSYWIALTNSSGIWMIGCMWIFICNYADFELKNRERMIIAYCALATIILLSLPQNNLYQGLVMAYLFLLIPFGWMLLRIVKHCLKHPCFDSTMLFIAITPLIGLGTHDWMNLAFHLQHPYLMHYSAPIIFVPIGWALLRRFTNAINEVETLNRELEIRVDEREDKLRQAFETINTLEKQKALKDERERIMRDIHDGVGGQLVSALAMMEKSDRASKDVTDVLVFALDDLRLMIDSLAPEEEGLPELLSMFKYRYEPKLKEQGIELQWRQSDLPELSEFSPRDSLQLLRIIQESFTNILKHARASQIEVAIAVDQATGRASICICDNGDGFPSRVKKKGRGLSNMQRRASDIGIEIEFFNQSEGACVRLWLTPQEESKNG